MKDIASNNSGYLIFDEMVQNLLQTGLLSIKEMFLVIRSLTDIYDIIANQEKELLKRQPSEFRKKIKYFAFRRECLSHIILYSLIQISDYNLINLTVSKCDKEIYNQLYKKNDFEKEYIQYYNDIFTMVVDLFEDYICVSIEEELNEYIVKSTATNQVCLQICYLLISLSLAVETPVEQSLDWSSSFQDLMGVICNIKSKKHLLKSAFHEANTKTKNNKNFTFGFFLGDILKNF